MTPEEVHEFWFADALQDAAKAAQRMGVWFRPSQEIDQDIRRRFASALPLAGRGLLAAWEAQPRSCLALILVLDQFPRNIHRGRATAFAYDAQALQVTKRGIAAGHLQTLTTIEEAFFLMPFQHSEALASQREGIVLFQQMRARAPGEWRPVAESVFHYARLHLDIVKRFGRFPHRNAILGRASTPEELEYLASSNEAFGQAVGDAAAR